MPGIEPGSNDFLKDLGVLLPLRYGPRLLLIYQVINIKVIQTYQSSVTNTLKYQQSN